MKTPILALLLCAGTAFGQTPPASPCAVGSPHCGVLSWTAVTAPSTTTYGYNVYRGTTSGGETIISPLTTPNGVTCALNTATNVNTCTYIDNSTSSNLLEEGTTYFWYIRTVDLTSKAMSAPSTEVSGLIPITIVIPPSPNPITIVIK